MWVSISLREVTVKKDQEVSAGTRALIGERAVRIFCKFGSFGNS